MGDELPLFPLPHLYLRLALNRRVADGVHEALAADAHLALAPPLVLPPLTTRGASLNRHHLTSNLPEPILPQPVVPVCCVNEWNQTHLQPPICSRPNPQVCPFCFCLSEVAQSLTQSAKSCTEQTELDLSFALICHQPSTCGCIVQACNESYDAFTYCPEVRPHPHKRR